MPPVENVCVFCRCLTIILSILIEWTAYFCLFSPYHYLAIKFVLCPSALLNNFSYSLNVLTSFCEKIEINAEALEEWEVKIGPHAV